MPTRRHTERRGLLIGLLSAACLAVAVGYTLYAAQRGDVPTAAVAQEAATLAEAPQLLFRSTALGESHGRVAAVPLSDPRAQPAITQLQCERVAYAADRGVCLTADRGFPTTYRVYVFGPDLQPRRDLALAGLPSRAQLSPDGRYAATTVFVTGHSYAQGGFSTETAFFDTATGERLGEMEQFAVTRDGAPFASVDFNFWGVTFAPDSNRFYATLASRGSTYLIEGDLTARTATVLRDNVECPSLSPDGTRLVFKKRVEGGGPVTWRLHLLDLSTMTETPLAETRSVDDQVAWLDDDTIAYGLPDDPANPTAVTNTWTLSVDGSVPPELLLPGSWSAVAVGLSRTLPARTDTG